MSPQELDEVSRRAEAAAAKFDAVRAQTDAAQRPGERRSHHAGLHAPGCSIRRRGHGADGRSRNAWPRPACHCCRSIRPEHCSLMPRSMSRRSAAIHKGMKVPVTIDGAPAPNLAGTVAEIVPAADPASHSFLVKIDLPSSSQMRAGMYGTAMFANGTQAGNPCAALRRRHARLALMRLRSRQPTELPNCAI